MSMRLSTSLRKWLSRLDLVETDDEQSVCILMIL